MTTAKVIAVTSVAAFVALACIRIALKTSSETASAVIGAASEISAVISVLTSVVAIVMSRRPVSTQRGGPSKAGRLTGAQLLAEDRLLDRGDEMVDLVRLIKEHRVVNCHGRRGAGKSFFLQHLADVINEHRRPEPRHPRATGVASAIYFDLADAAGFSQMEAQISQTAFAQSTAVWADFIDHVDHVFGRRNVLLVLDNVNDRSIWGPLGEAVYRYLARRGEDRVILGSVEEISLANLRVSPLRMEGLDLPSTELLVTRLGVGLTVDAIAALHAEHDGLPLHVRVMATRGAEEPQTQTTSQVVIEDRLIPDHVPSEIVGLLAHVALLALINRRISVTELERCPLARVPTMIGAASQMALIDRLPDAGRELIKMHDVVRDAVFRRWTQPVAEAAAHFFARADEQGRREQAALLAMFADPAAIGADRFDRVVGEVILDAVSNKNYTLLATLHARGSQNETLVRFRSSSPWRSDVFGFGRACELAGTGRYEEAESELLATGITQIRWDRMEPRSDLHADMRYMQADIAHLRNRYNEAAEMFAELGAWARWAGEASLHAQCLWAQGHVLRHQGRDFDEALALFSKAERLAAARGDLDAKAYSMASATAIKVFLGSVPDDEEQRLDQVEQELASASTHDGYLLKVWKAQAQVRWARGETGAARKTVEAAIRVALTRNDRALYNLYFERAEFRRLGGQPDLARDDYATVLDFGLKNGDRNLIANTRLGLVLADLTVGKWQWHSSAHDARASVLDARATALDADIQATARSAERITAMLDNPKPVVANIRLVLF